MESRPDPILSGMMRLCQSTEVPGSRTEKAQKEKNGPNATGKEKKHQRSAVTKDGRSGPSCSVHHDPHERSHLFGPIRLMPGTPSWTLSLFHAIDLVGQCSRFIGGGFALCWPAREPRCRGGAGSQLCGVVVGAYPFPLGVCRVLG